MNNSNNKTQKVFKGHHDLPHREFVGSIYHIIFRLFDSIPEKQKEQWTKEKEQFLYHDKRHDSSTNYSLKEEYRIKELFHQKLEEILDSGMGICLLKKSECAEIVKKALYFNNGTKYKLYKWCIMPNHVHVVVELLGDEIGQLHKIIQSWKAFSAHEINKLLERTGAVWMSDYYDRRIRDDEEYRLVIEYIENNPKKAELENWPWIG